MKGFIFVPMILLTGATGFLGSQVLRDLLKAKIPVKALKRKTSIIPSGLQDANWVDGDVGDYFEIEKLLSDVDTIIHSAAIVSFLPSERKKMMQCNVEGTANIVNAALATKVKRLIHVSSIAAIGENDDKSPSTENTEWKFSPKSSGYSVSKYLSENEAWRGSEEGLDVLVVNPSIIIGPTHNWRSGTGALFRKVQKGLTHYPMGTVGWVDVRDVSRAIVALYNSKIVNQRYILNATNESYKNVFTEMATNLDMPIPMKPLTPLKIRFLVIYDGIRSVLLNKNKRFTKNNMNSSSKTLTFSASKIEKELAFKFTPLSQTIAETCSALIASK